MTTSLKPPAAVCRPQRPHALCESDRQRTAAGSTSESRMADLLARLADADAIGASRIRAWDRLQERRSA